MTRDVLNWFILSVALIATGVVIYLKYQEVRPCEAPIAYSVGAVDTRFGIGTPALVESLKASAAIWNKAAGKTVLAYDPEAALKVNLVYDEREQNAQLGAGILETQELQDAARAKLDRLQAEFTVRQASYNQKVEAINARGGARPAEAAELRKERATLETLANSVNTQVVTFNASVAALNAAVEEYNKSAGHTFEAGQYVRDAQGERINIYMFVGATQLKRVLAHEFGHAIGLNHNDDPKAIMYSKNESGNLVPTSADLAALKALCGT